MFSGFLMDYSYKEKIAQFSFVEFIKKRFKILYPMTVASMLVGIIVCLVDGFLFDYQVTGKPVNLWYIFLSLTLTQTGWVEEVINPYGSATWFVCVLLLVYIIYFYVCKISAGNAKKYIAICSLFFFLGWICLKQKFHLPFLYETSGRGYVAFFGGVLLYELYKSKTVNHKLFAKGLFVVLLLAIVIGVMNGKGLAHVLGISGGGRTLVFVVFPALLLMALDIEWIKAVLSSKALICVSKLNMSIFLIHGLVFVAIIMLDRYYSLGIPYANKMVFWIIMAIVFAVGFVWHIVVEKWLIKKLYEVIPKFVKRECSV